MMWLQVHLAMEQDWLSKEESGDLLDQLVHVVTTNQELCYSTRNFFRLAWDYLGGNGPLRQEIVTWPCHINHFKWRYDKAFVGNRLFVSGIVDLIHKMFHVFIHSCNTTSLNDVKTRAISEFRELQRQVERV